MNWLDFVLLFVLGASVLSGIRKGIARTSIGFVAAVAGLVMALWFHSSAAAYLEDYLPSRTAANVLGFLLIFVLTLAAGALVGHIADQVVKAVHLSWLNRLLGAGFGLLRGVLVAALIVFMLMAFALKTPPRSVSRSFLAPWVIHGARAIAAAAPHDVKQAFERSYERLKQAWVEHMPERDY